jgi:hypothetical protein
MLTSWLRLSNNATLLSQGKLSVLIYLLPPGFTGVTAKLLAVHTLYCMIVHMDWIVSLLTL